MLIAQESNREIRPIQLDQITRAKKIRLAECNGSVSKILLNTDWNSGQRTVALS